MTKDYCINCPNCCKNSIRIPLKITPSPKNPHLSDAKCPLCDWKAYNQAFQGQLGCKSCPFCQTLEDELILPEISS
jgi:hypothetical protein